VFFSGWIVLERVADRAGLDWPCCFGVHRSPACLLDSPAFVQTSSVVFFFRI
jgi:hypothetical protein